MAENPENRRFPGSFWNRLPQDVKFAVRRFRQSSGFALTVVATLAVGLAAACARFTVIHGVMLRPLPYEKPDELVEIKEAGSRGARDYGASFVDLREWRQRNHTLEDLAFYSANNHVSFLDGNGASLEVIAPRISGNLFATLGVEPSLGRGFRQRADTGSVDDPDSNTIILSDMAWRELLCSPGYDSQPGGDTQWAILHGDRRDAARLHLSLGQRQPCRVDTGRPRKRRRRAGQA